MNSKTNGTLTGIGLGPGDPSLMTVAARDLLMSAKVVTYIHANGRTSIARKIASDYLMAGVKEIAIPVDMQATQQQRRRAYDDASVEIIAELSSGEDVAFLCEGDPLFYGSFVHMAEKISEKIPEKTPEKKSGQTNTQDDFLIKSIPGVSSIHASASAAAVSLASDNETFSIIPATLGEAELSVALAMPGARALIKIGNNFEKLKRQLKLSGRLAGTLLVTNASQPDEKIENLSDVSKASYFSLALVPAQKLADADAPQGAVIVAVNKAGLLAALKLKKALPQARLLARFQSAGVDEVFSSTPETLKKLFSNGTPIIALCSSGIIIRSLAGALNDKKTEPPVVALSPNGAYALPLLGGHNGANRSARAVANILGGAAAITTASDGEFGIALDDPPAGWHVANPDAAKAVVAAMLGGQKININAEVGSSEWLLTSGAPFNVTTDTTKEPSILVTALEIKNPDKTLVLHPPVLALGVGAERGCDVDELYELAMAALASGGYSKNAVACVCSLDLKSDENAVLELATRLDVPTRFFTSDELNKQTSRLANPSDAVFAEVGCYGVSEGAALASVASVSSEGTLVVEKQKSKRATVAVGLSPVDINPETIGRGRGRLYIVGTGPGREGWRTPDATRILSMVSDVVGYELYLDIVSDLIVGKTRHTSQLSEEEARVRMALELAGSGRDVALVSSGDPGIYAMASLAFELLDHEDKPEWNRLEIEVVPGISAFQAAAARIGAPMGHDFCLISLSDLLTPWEIIEQRLVAAAKGGFVVAFYNPVSKRRTHQLETARDILLGERGPDTPVVLGRNLGRDGETVRVITLGELTSEDADMLTMVIVGGPQTRAIERGVNKYVYTPRGYAKKMNVKINAGEKK